MIHRILEDRKLALLIIVAAVWAVYTNSLWNKFAYDDIWIILENDRVHRLRDLRAIWLTPYWPEWGTQLGLYRPLTIFLFAVQWAVSDGAPWFFHAINVLAHTLVTVMVYLLVDRLYGRAAAFAAGLVFAIHPLHTEAVANMVGQGEMWAALGVVAGCLVYVSRPAGEAVTYRRVAAIAAIYAAALLAKEHAAVLPGLLVLLDFAQRRVELTRAGLKRYAGAVFFLLGILSAVLLAYITMRVHVLGSFGGSDVAPGLPFLKGDDRVLNAFRAWPEYMRLLFVPLDLSVNYAPGVILPVDSLTPMVLLGIMLLLVTIGLMIATPWAPRAGLAAGWFFITILPVSNLLFPIGVLVAERTLYLPSLAACFVAGYAWEALLQSTDRAKRRAGYIAAAVVVLVFGVRTYVRNPDWKTLHSVWRSLSRDHPESYMSQWVFAVTAVANGRPDFAEQHWRMAHRIWPDDARFLGEFGGFYLDHKRYADALPLLERSRDLAPWAPRSHEVLAYANLLAGRPAEAQAIVREAMRMEGAQLVLDLSILAATYDELGDYNRAAGAWRAAAHAPSGGFWLLYANAARALDRIGMRATALSTADTAIERAPAGSAMKVSAVALKKAIAHGCYRGANSACDPLQNWTFSVSNYLTDTLANSKAKAKRN